MVRRDSVGEERWEVMGRGGKRWEVARVALMMCARAGIHAHFHPKTFCKGVAQGCDMCVIDDVLSHPATDVSTQ